MKGRSLIVLTLLSLAASACGSADDEKSRPTSCQQICATAKTLNCANENTPACISDCDLLYQTILQLKPSCKPDVDAAAACLASRSAADFECSADGRGSPKPQVCAVEQAKANACVAG